MAAHGLLSTLAWQKVPTCVQNLRNLVRGRFERLRPPGLGEGDLVRDNLTPFQREFLASAQLSADILNLAACSRRTGS